MLILLQFQIKTNVLKRQVRNINFKWFEWKFIEIWLIVITLVSFFVVEWVWTNQTTPFLVGHVGTFTETRNCRRPEYDVEKLFDTLILITPIV